MRIHPTRLQNFCAGVFAACGMRSAQSLRAAEILVDANRQGLVTHGVSRLPVYAACLRSGRINPNPSLVMERRAAALGLVDGDNGLGLLVADEAMRQAMALANDSGAGFVTVRNSSHCGAVSYYCRQATAQGKIGMAFTNAPSAMPPWGGSSPYFGTNPIAIAFPGPDGEDVVVDLSTSVTARGRIIQAAREGRSIPEGWAVDRAGRPTTDPKRALEGAVLPMAGPKGYALALAVELLAGVLAGAAWGTHVGWMYDDGAEPVRIGHAFLAIDVAPLVALPVFTQRVALLVAEIKSQPVAAGSQGILIPGERRRESARRNADGIELSDAVVSELAACAERAGAPALVM